MRMRGQHCDMKRMAVAIVALLVLAGARTQCSAQDAAPPPAPGAALRSSDELDQMLGSIALYPDPLIGIMLPAATQPTQIVQADRYVSEGDDPNQIPQQPWDASVQGLAHYPTVLKWMDDNLDWTTELGQAFLNQQADVMDSIQRLRAKAQALGNLQSTPQEDVESDNGTIAIDPVDPNEMYLPTYQPDTIYYQPGVYCTFGVGFPLGLWLGFDWDWRNHHLIAWGRGHERPQDWWHRPPAARHAVIVANNSTPWRPRTRAASVIVAGGDRGYESHGVSRPYATPKPLVPGGMTSGFITTGRGAGVSRPGVQPGVTVIGRGTVAARPAVSPGVTIIGHAPEVSRPIERSAPSESAFGGSQSAHEVRDSSSRGQASRGSISSGSSRSGGSSGRR